MKWLDKAKTQEPVYDHAWFDKQDALFNQRVELFQAKGMDEFDAKRIALELYLRDYDSFKEIHCLECKNLKGTSPLFKCVKDKPLNQDALHKCLGFIPLENQYD